MESKILGGRYEILERVGMGGMAVVYKATDKLLSRNVAVKILREEFKENEEFIRRFKVESQAAASLSHQNIVQIYDVGEEDGIHYIVMELLEGVTLKNYMNSKDEILPRREAMNYAMQICRALEHAHSKHVIHRDIKPQNIVLTESGKIKVADFGIARAANNTTTVNSGSYAVGSAHYLSPEQARGGYTDNRSDIYSFGVVMYELFTGSLPFDAEESIGVVMQHINEEPLPPSEVNPEISPGIEAIIMRAMCKEQRLRYANAAEILEDLVTVYQNPGVNPATLNAAGEEIEVRKNNFGNGKGRSSSSSRKKKNKMRKSIIAAVLITLFVVVFGGLGIYTISTGHIPFFDTGKEYEIPDFMGMTFDEAAYLAERSSNNNVKFTVSIKEEVFSDEEKGTVIEQNPDGGFKIKQSREIKLKISRGPVLIKLSDYSGKDFKETLAMLEEKGLKVTVEEEDNSTYAEGIIIRHLPSEGTQMGEGDEITLYVSKGAENTYVPNVVGKKEGDASAEIERWGLQFKIKEEASDSVAKGEVIRQSIKHNTVVLTGTVVELTVSSGKVKEPEKDDTTTDTTTSNKFRKISISLTELPKDKPTKVKIMLGGKKVYEADVSSATGNATVTFDADSTLNTTHGADIYYNGDYKTTKEVK
ncbi:MAG: Stk1 family PASTA domain-containing Ser/Thr kinase [Oscillospiraceae bacterium]|nr:Stk1 family PASTA domain-containing Ser/Thr kinase [Oscillospiraceae bacterium]